MLAHIVDNIVNDTTLTTPEMINILRATWRDVRGMFDWWNFVELR